MTDERTTDELEARLRDGLRRGALPAAPATLLAALERVPDAPVGAGRAGGDRGRRSSSRSGWGVIGLAAVLAVSGAVALAVGQRSPSPGPTPVPSSPAPAVGVRITYEAVWMAEQQANEADIQAIGTILRKRLDATGLAGYGLDSGGGSRFVVDLPLGIDPEPIRRLLGVTGEVVAVPTGDVAPEVGSALDPGRSARLFSSIDIASAALVPDQGGNSAVQLKLKPSVAESFRAWTAASVGQSMALAVDGVVVLAPTIQGEIPNGEIELTFGGDGGDFGAEQAARLVAIIQHGPLPVPIREIAAETLPSGSPPVPVATAPVSESPSPAGFVLEPLRSDVGCDTIPAPYESFVFHIDPTAAETVWAIANTGARLRTEWGSSFRGLVGPPPTVVDGRGLSLGDGAIVRTPNGAWPVIGGHFVCPSGEMVSIFDEPPPA